MMGSLGLLRHSVSIDNSILIILPTDTPLCRKQLAAVIFFGDFNVKDALLSVADLSLDAYKVRCRLQWTACDVADRLRIDMRAAVFCDDKLLFRSLIREMETANFV